MKFKEPIAKVKEQYISKENKKKSAKKTASKKKANTIEMLKIGDFFMKKGSKKIYKRGSYSREIQKYSYSPVEDMNREYFMKKGTEILIDFEY